ncbi:MAG: tRNA modification GTPase [Verrucomicrobiota bacterium]
MDVQDTIVAAATPAGRSALAVVRIDGPLASELSAKGLGRSAPLPERRAAAGVWRDLRGEPVDQVVAVRWDAGRSFTGGDTLELTCHGNPLLVRRIVEDLLARGARMAEPGEFTRRAFLTGRMDLTQAEGVADLIHANGERALEAARRLLAGELGRLVAAWSERLLSTLATLEAHIDFPEEDLPAEDPRGPAAALAALASELSGYAGTARHDAALRGGLRVAVVGAPNAGKSSLLNALTGASRALVSPEAGTTRDWIEAPVGGLPLAVTAVDTAGLREGGGAVERAGMERSLEQAESALLDGRDGERLRAALAAALVAADLAPGADELVVSVRHADALRRAAGALEEARRLLNAPARTELAAERCREALDALGEIVGRIDNERMLDKLFASFCIGK